VNLDAEGDHHRDELEPEDKFDDDNQEIQEVEDIDKDADKG
jgi:hypothetical protein